MAPSDSTGRLEGLLADWRLLLRQWSANGRLRAAAREALLLPQGSAELEALLGRWQAGDFRGLPAVSLLSGRQMQGALGAYGAGTATIYLNAEWLAGATPEQAIAVLSEELGHHLDAVLNRRDTPGDEGELFARQLLGVPLSAAERAQIQAENDQASLEVDGRLVAVEKAGAAGSPVVAVTAVANGAEADGSPVVFRISRTGSTALPLTLGYRLFGTAQSGLDYFGAASGTVTIPAGRDQIELSLPVITDGAMWDPGETVILRLDPSADGAYGIRPAQQFATATITAEGLAVTVTGAARPGASMGEQANLDRFVVLRRGGTIKVSQASSYAEAYQEPPAGLQDVVQVYSNNLAFAALKSDGTVASWGLKNKYNVELDWSPPSDLANVERIFSTNYGFAALGKDGSVQSWGYNSTIDLDPYSNAFWSNLR